ncbi:hypothetical protein EI94DRAFT_913663 [Lactarius quietus]|nr:hypothetical protein EI94DRAFT_913663 [Lactarius quietus]
MFCIMPLTFENLLLASEGAIGYMLGISLLTFLSISYSLQPAGRFKAASWFPHWQVCIHRSDCSVHSSL